MVPARVDVAVSGVIEAAVASADPEPLMLQPVTAAQAAPPPITATATPATRAVERLVSLRMGKFLLERFRGTRFRRLRRRNGGRVVGLVSPEPVWRPGAGTKMADPPR